MTTTILDGETYPEALQRRYAEEAAIEKRINIIELVKEAGAEPNYILLKCEALERFAALVRAETLEEAAKLCEQGTGDAIQTETLKLLLQERGRIASVIRGLK